MRAMFVPSSLNDLGSGWSRPLPADDRNAFREVKPLAQIAELGTGRGSAQVVWSPPMKSHTVLYQSKWPSRPPRSPPARHGRPSPAGFAPGSRLPTEPRSVSQTAAPQLPPPALWGLGGGTEITGKGRPRGWRPHPKAALGTEPQGLCQLTHSLNRVEPKVRFYCKSRKILPGQASPEPSSVKGLRGFSWPYPQKLL